MEPLTNNANQSGVRLTFSAGAAGRMPTDSTSDPYGNDKIVISDTRESHGNSSEVVVSESEGLVGFYGKFEVAFPIGLGANYKLSLLPGSGSKNNTYDIPEDQRSKIGDTGVLSLENTLHLCYTPVGNDSSSRFRLTLEGGPSLISTYSEQISPNYSGGTLPTESSSWDSSIGISGGINLGLHLGAGIGLELSGSAGYYGDAGATLGANLGLTYSL